MSEQTAEQVYQQMNCWAPVSIRTRLSQLAGDGRIEKRLGDTPSGNGVRNEYRLLRKAEAK